VEFLDCFAALAMTVNKRALIIWIIMIVMGTPAAHAGPDTSDRLVSDAYFVAKNLLKGKDFEKSPQWLKDSKAVIIIPSLYKGGFILGGSGGSGVILGRLEDGSWSYPGFVDIGGGSLGLQIGLSVSEAMIFVQSKEQLSELLDGHFRFGGDAGIAVATVGAGLSGSTAVSSKTDFIVIAKSSGLYAGLSLEGSSIRTRSDLAHQFYGQPTSLQDIVITGSANNPRAEDLRSFLQSVSDR
jgi:lipid-binding SYLF domain-containing protein